MSQHKSTALRRHAPQSQRLGGDGILVALIITLLAFVSIAQQYLLRNCSSYSGGQPVQPYFTDVAVFYPGLGFDNPQIWDFFNFGWKSSSMPTDTLCNVRGASGSCAYYYQNPFGLINIEFSKDNKGPLTSIGAFTRLGNASILVTVNGNVEVVKATSSMCYKSDRSLESSKTINGVTTTCRQQAVCFG
ncbi:hypothetical protein M427DRAFT_46363 [Gonapodya prolifera JEL478]|uniref:Uncharacterized protein n=1 Tax=Gonapodya prolifera (strain JEL478) TaxID=1344416 RepID=A0A139A6V6_GONPJ|nr:hypothetical protein M427DRAFT_46363 [Gonapodya prolifera JEL478]|eukprot:KXS12434.1 hypothetical protein M427DRAFT_46363 [Gonapodya prolifera JEL478]